jgi:hypothetical protein
MLGVGEEVDDVEISKARKDQRRGEGSVAIHLR